MSDLHDQAYENMRDLQALRERELHRVHDRDDEGDMQWLLNQRQAELGGAEVQPGRTVVRARGDRAGATRDPGPSATPSVYVRGDDGQPVAVYMCPLCEAMSPEPGKCWRCYQ